MPVYIIRAGDTEMVKIGWTHDINERLANLQGCHYEPLAVLRLIEGTRETETHLHVYFDSHRVRGEWFRLVPEMLSLTEVPPAKRVFSAERRIKSAEAVRKSWRDGALRRTHEAQKAASLFCPSDRESLNASHALASP